MPTSLDAYPREQLGRFLSFVQISLGAHRVESRHHHSTLNLRILLDQRKGSTAELGQLVDADDEDDIHSFFNDFADGCRSARAAAGIDKRVTVHTLNRKPTRQMPRQRLRSILNLVRRNTL